MRGLELGTRTRPADVGVVGKYRDESVPSLDCSGGSNTGCCAYDGGVDDDEVADELFENCFACFLNRRCSRAAF